MVEEKFDYVKANKFPQLSSTVTNLLYENAYLDRLYCNNLSKF